MRRAGRVAPVVDVAHGGKALAVGDQQRLGPGGISVGPRRAARHPFGDQREGAGKGRPRRESARRGEDRAAVRGEEGFAAARPVAAEVLRIEHAARGLDVARQQARQLAGAEILRAGLGEALEGVGKPTERQMGELAVDLGRGRHAIRQIDRAGGIELGEIARAGGDPERRMPGDRQTAPRQRDRRGAQVRPGHAGVAAIRQPEAAAWPGTAIDSGPSRLRRSRTAGQPNNSSSRPSTRGYAAGSRRAGATMPKSIASAAPSALAMIITPPPPRPLIQGSSTPSASEVASAASMALPPAARTSAPTSAAPTCWAATSPPLAFTTFLRIDQVSCGAARTTCSSLNQMLTGGT